MYRSHIHWVARGTGTPKDKDEVNRRDVCESDEWVCVLEVIGTPSKLNVIRKAAPLFKVWGERREVEVELVTVILRKLNS